jgi:hypothetical protein
MLLLALAGSAVGCGGPLRYTPRPTQRAPEADATIVAEVNQEQANTRLEIRVEHLAPPDRIQPGAVSYVAFTRRNPSAQWMRVGTLRYNPGRRVGELVTTAPDTAFELIVSAENNTAPASPSGAVIVQQRVGTPVGPNAQ